MILAFGDSLTNGFGVDADLSYPSQMQEKTALNVMNAGVDGEFSSEGLARLHMYLEHKPDLVILCHGANDMVNQFSTKELKNNLLEMIKLIKQSEADVLLVGVPEYNSHSFQTHTLYEEIAQETDVLFENSVLTHIGLNDSLKNDYVHPNEKGYELMADTFVDMLKEIKSS